MSKYKVTVEFPIGHRLKKDEIEVEMSSDNFDKVFISDYARIKLRLTKWTGIKLENIKAVDVRRVDHV